MQQTQAQMARGSAEIIEGVGLPDVRIIGTPDQIKAGRQYLAHLLATGRTLLDTPRPVSPSKTTVVKRTVLESPRSSLGSDWGLEESGTESTTSGAVWVEEDEDDEGDSINTCSQSPWNNNDQQIQQNHPLAPNDLAIPPSDGPFIFNNAKHFANVKTLFAIASDPEHGSRLKWNKLCKLLQGDILQCRIKPGSGAGFAVIRPARKGLPKRSVTIHQTHGKNPWLEREVLEHIAVALGRRFGWRRDDFVLEA